VGSPEVVQEVLRLSATPLWKWGPVVANRYDVDALLCMLAIVAEMSRENLIRLPHFQQLTTDMWTTFGRKMVLLFGSFHLANIVFLVVIMLLRATRPALETVGHMTWLAMPGAIWFVYMDVRSAHVSRGGRSVMSAQPYLLFSAVISTIYTLGVVLALSFFYAHPNRSSDAGALGIATAFGWLRFVNYLRMWSFLGELVFTIGNILFRDVTRWLLLAMILIVAVLCLMVGLISFQREGAKDGTSNLMSYSEEPVNYKVIAGPIFGEPDWDIVFEPQLHLNSAAVFTYFLYTFIISVVL